ncbi:MAG: 5'-methylthioadenosine/adenosylhomocysteine nucleosidase [Erysipelotrichaceae bacterium]|jgi:adenosylhomocysteine nucleosidase
MIAIMVAMDCEREAVEQIITDKRNVVSGNQVYTTGIIANKEVIVATCGIGKVISAINTVRILENYDVDLIINIGTAGGICDDAEIADVIVASKLTYHDFDLYSIDGIEPSFDNNYYTFVTDETLTDLAYKVIDSDDYNVYIKPLVSGDAFVCDEEKIAYIQKYFPEAYGCDMEACSIAHCCYEYGKKFLIIRSFSDIVTKKGNELDFNEYKFIASKRAAQFTKMLLQKL